MRASLAMLALLAMLAQAASTGDSLYPVNGTVTDALSGKPLARVRLSLSATEGSDPHFSAVTGADGRFAFRAPAGKYHLMGERAGYPQQSLNGVPGGGFSSAVLVGPGKRATELAFRLHPGGAITGHVLDDVNDPVAQANVAVYRVIVFQGRKRTVMYRWVYTDGTGEYRAGGLPEGDYYVMVNARPWFAQQTGGLQMEGNEAGLSWPSMYSGNTMDPGAAALVPVKEGGEATADIALIATQGAKLNLHLTSDSAKPGRAYIGMLQHGLGGQKAWYRNETTFLSNEGGAIENVSPGTYDVIVNLPEHKAPLYKTVSVSSGEVNVDLSGAEVPVMTGQARVDGARSELHDPVQLMFLDETTGGPMPVVTKPDGTFEAALFTGGPYRVSAVGGKYTLRSMEADGAKVNGAMIESLYGGAVKLTVVLTEDVANIEGMLRRGKEAVPGAAVMVISRKGEAVPAEDQTDSDGSFNLRDLPLGDYDVLILESGLHIEYTRQEALAPYRERMRPLHLTERGTQKLEIDLDGPAETSAPH